MKNNLIINLGNSEAELINAQNGVNHIHNSRGSYDYRETVAYTHALKTGWWKVTWSHETRYREETRFDQQRFNRDLASANARLQQAQQKNLSALNEIRQEIISNQAQVQRCLELENEVGNLKNNNLSLLSKLSSLNISSYNLPSQVFNIKQKQINLANQKAQSNQDIGILPTKIQLVKNDNMSKQAQIETAIEQNQHGSALATRSYNQLHQKIMSLNENEKAILTYEALIRENNDIIKVFENCGYSTENVALISIHKENQKVFAYCLNKGINFDALVSEKETLALSIINKAGNFHNDFFMENLFSSNQDLKLSVYMACADNNFKALEILLKHDQFALRHFKDVEGCGLTVLQHAIASNNIELVKFVINHDAGCFKEQVKGYGSYFSMVLTFNCPEIINLISKVSDHADIHQQLVAFIQNQEIDMFERAIENMDLPSKEIVSVLKLCAANNSLGIEAVANKIVDIKEIFSAAVRSNDLELAKQLIYLQADVLNFEFVSNLVNEHQDKNSISFLTQILSPEVDEVEQLVTGVNEYEAQSEII